MTLPVVEQLQSEMTRLLAAGVSGQVFPGASACIGWRNGDRVTWAEAVSGHHAPGGPLVETGTPYDLASLTKPFVSTAALRLVALGKLSLEARTDSVVPDVRGGVAGAVSIEQLFTHRAGLAPWGGLYLDVPHEPGTSAARRWVLSEASRRPYEGADGRKEVYSDLGYLIGGEVVARAYGEPLDRTLSELVTGPLHVSDEVYYAGALPSDRQSRLTRMAPPTERCEWRGRLLRGEVHDENAAALGGVAGHAGLFGTAHGVAVLGMTMLDVLAGKSEFLPQALLRSALKEREGGTYRFGWESKSGEGSAAGRRLSPESFGHLGFTGTSIWCDPKRHLVAVLLTNRVYPTRANEKIKGYRPAFHDAVAAAFDAVDG